MYDSKPVITGIVIFLVIFTYPLWSNVGSASTPPKPDAKPALEYAKKANLPQTCVAPKEFMRNSHMVLLDNWRDHVVRQQDRIYVVEDENGNTVAQYKISLTSECMKCHSNKKTFCDSCHNYMAISPYCWDCHLEPKEVK